MDISFELRTVKGPTLGIVMFNNSSFNRESKFTSNNICPVHSEYCSGATTDNSQI